jgi:hypothetical protein
MPTTERKLRVFICHASQDKPVVRELYQRLLAEDWIDPWLDEEKLLPGHDWDMEIEKAVEAADVVIVCLSDRSVTKEGYVQRELRFVLDIALQKPEGTIFIIPLKLEDCESPRRLRTWQYVEYFPPDKRDSSFRRVKVSMQERWKSLGQSVAVNELEFSVSQESLSSRIISKKLSDARQALQNDQLQIALGIYTALAKQRLRLKEVIHDLEDVSIVYSESKELWTVLATAYRMDGDISRAQEYENKIKPPHVSSVTVQTETDAKDDREDLRNNLDNSPRDDNQSTSASLLLPSTISVETAGGKSTPIFYKGDSLPSQRREVFSTAADNQSKVEVHLVMGENKLANDNKSLGKFFLDGIPLAPKGVPEIEIMLEVSQELELTVTATDKTSGRKKNFQVVKLSTIEPPPTKDPLPPKPNSDLDDLFGGASGFSDLFGSIFGGEAQGVGASTRTSSRQQPQRYQQELEITLEEAYTGTTRIIDGNGIKKRLYIPAGVQEGSKIRVAGAGSNGTDLYFTISIKPHRFFAQTGSDLHLHYPISETLAYQGGELQVPILEKGKSIFIAIPPNTKDKKVFRFANRGFPSVKKPTKFGDFYLTVDLYDPQKIPQELKKLLDDINNYMR